MKQILIIIISLLVLGCNKKLKKLPIIEDAVKEAKKEMVLGVDKFNTTSEKIIVPVQEPVSEIVYFEFDSEELTEESKLTIQSAVAKCKGLIIKGYACPIGTDDYNYRLGLRRANSVYKYIKKTFNINMVCASGGEYELASRNPGEYYLNRRVTIKGE